MIFFTSAPIDRPKLPSVARALDVAVSIGGSMQVSMEMKVTHRLNAVSAKMRPMFSFSPESVTMPKKSVRIMPARVIAARNRCGRAIAQLTVVCVRVLFFSVTRKVGAEGRINVDSVVRSI